MSRLKEQYVPLRIVADVASPIAMMSHESLAIDGLLEYAAWLNGAPIVQRDLCPAEPNECPINFKIPIKRIGHKDDPDWYWSASWATFPEGFETTKDHWNRRTDFADPELQPALTSDGWTQKFSAASGRYKGYHCPLPQIVTPIIEWFCLGCPERIATLLKRITHLGKKRGYGGGEVIRWTIFRADEDFSCWRDGRPMRAIPDRDGDYRRGYHRLRAPYWSHIDKGQVILPDSRTAVMSSENGVFSG